MEILGERWTFLILREAFYGVRRFSDMQRNLGIARNILSTRLQSLVGAGHLRAAALSGEPERYEYRLTQAGARPLPGDRDADALGRRAPAGRARPAGGACATTSAAMRPTRCWSARTAAKELRPRDVTPERSDTFAADAA
jgi:hypothetical protein